MKEKIEFSVQMTAGEIFRFMMYHMYHQFSGIFGIFLSLLSLLLLLVSFDSLTAQSKVILVFIAAWFTIVFPIILFSRSKGQAKRNKANQKPLNYRLDQAGITVSQDEAEQTIAWENLMKIVETKSQFLVYSSRIHAFVFPKKAIGQECDAVRELLVRYTEGTGIRFKGAVKRRKAD